MAFAELGGAAGDAIGSAIADAENRGDYEEADRLRREAAAQYDTLLLPTDMAQLGPSAMEGIQLDPRIREARMAALQQMMQVGMEGGMDPQSRAALAQAQQAAASQEAASRGATLADAQRRGMLGSTATLAANLGAGQAAANRVSDAGIQAAGDARQRALQALQATGQLGAGIEQDAYGQAANLADRRDAIAEFNSRNRQAFGQQRFDNQMGIADKRYGASADLAKAAEDRAARRSEQYRRYGRDAGSIAGSAADLATMGGV